MTSQPNWFLPVFPTADEERDVWMRAGTTDCIHQIAAAISPQAVDDEAAIYLFIQSERRRFRLGLGIKTP